MRTSAQRIAVASLVMLVMLASPATAQLHPNNARGFDAEKAYQFGDLDHINIFSGNLIVNIPLGQVFPVSDHLRYQFRLAYNGNPWDYQTDGTGAEAYPSRFTNAGLGWQLTLGNLVAPNDAAAKKLSKAGNWVYVAPDGSEHVFYRILHAEEAGTEYEANATPGDNDVVGYTRDASYLRLERIGASFVRFERVGRLTDQEVYYYYVVRYAVEFPDGTIHTFTSEEFVNNVNAPPPSSFDGSARFRLSRMEDRFGNHVSVAEQTSATGGTRTITDSIGREHKIAYTNQTFFQFRGSNESFGLINSLRLAAPNAKTIEYAFTYGAFEPISKPCVDTGAINQPTTATTFLQSVVAREPAADGAQPNPALVTYQMEHVKLEQDAAGSATCSGRAGHLTKLILPTGGRIEYAAGMRLFPQEKEGTLLDPMNPIRPVNVSAAVQSRTMVNTDGTRAEWKYQSHLRNPGKYFDPETNVEKTINRELLVMVTDPTGSVGAHYFNVYKGRAADACFPNASELEYGLPFTRTAQTGASDLFLSTETFPEGCASYVAQNVNGCPALTWCRNAAGGTVTATRRTYAAYDHDTKLSGSEFAFEHHNQRLRAGRHLFRDDSGCTNSCHVETRLSDFDGLGHYRTEARSSNISSTPTRTTRINYNANVTAANYPNVGGPATFMIAKTAPWLLALHDQVRTTEGSGASATQTCFDRTTGLLTRQRVVGSATTPSADLVTVFSHSGGNVTGEKRYGGDSTPLEGMGDWCVENPGTAAYSVTHAYSAGVRVESRYENATFKSFDVTADANSGLPTVVRDTAGIATNLTYDLLGRVVEARPKDEAWTRYTYDLTNQPASVAVETINREDGTVAGKRRISYDGFGRLIETRRRMPIGWAATRVTYDLLGRRVSESMPEYRLLDVFEPAFVPAYRTTFAYDRLGRPVSTTAPDGTATQWSYIGARITDRTVTIDGKPVTTRETFDGHGRLRAVTEDAAGKPVTTRYTYDVGNRLATVSTTAGGVTQNRLFTYDARGLLRSERHPEKGLAGNGTTDYAAYDAGGHLRNRRDGAEGGAYDVQFSYDFAERLVGVSRYDATAGEWRPIKEFVYGAGNQCSEAGCDYSNGKLLSATRHNYVPEYGDVVVEERYSYTHPTGRPVSRQTTVTGAGSFAGATFVLQQSWNGLGELASITYPVVGTTSPSRTVSYEYTDGLLAAITGYAKISYRANGVTDTITHGTGAATVTEQWLEDDHRMPRPRAIEVTGPNGLSWKYGDYSYDGAGNITSIGGRKFEYDSMSRLIRWIDTFTSGATIVDRQLDAFGNAVSLMHSGYRRFPDGRKTSYVSGVVPYDLDSATNHYNSHVYDDAGSVISDGRHVYRYDALAMTTALEGSGRNERYLYSADDERLAIVDLVSNGRTTWTLRDLGHRLLRTVQRNGTSAGATWTWVEDDIWRGDRLLASHSPSGIKRYHLDHLGSPRLITSATGTRIGEQHFTPFGEGGTLDGGRLQFTGHERDRPQTGSTAGTLDYMHARYYDPAMGRFLSVDPGKDWDPKQSQSWNLYSYVRNNPVNATDPTGRTLKFGGNGDFRLQRQVVSTINANLHGSKLQIHPSGAARLVRTDVQGPPSPQQAALAASLAGAINSGPTVSIALTENSKSVLFGSFNLQTIDMADVRALGTGTPFSAAGTIAHEVTEQTLKQAGGVSSFPAAHASALQTSNAVDGMTEAPTTITQTGNTTTISVPYCSPTDFRTVEIDLVDNNVTDVRRPPQ